MGGLGCPSFSDFSLPEQPPVPISSTYNSGAGTGSITFDQPLDTGVTLDPADFLRGLTGSRRPVSSVAYGSSTVINITGMGSAVFTPLALGWQYTPGSAPLMGANGLAVAGFTGFTG